MKLSCLATLSALIVSSPVLAQEFSADIPESVTTPNVVDTRTLGTLNFFDGMPSPETVQKVFDNLDLIRATTVFLDGIPIAAMEGMFRGLLTMANTNEILVAEDLFDARSIWLTPNTTTIYVTSVVDTREGPVVLDIPPGFLALMDDAAFLYVSDFGALGPDKGEGGKYLLLPPGHDGEVPEGYFVIESPTYFNWFLGRLSPDPEDGPAPVVAAMQEGMNIYPLSQADAPPVEVFVNISGVQHNTVHANNIEFYDEMNEAVQREPEGVFGPEMTGALASIGIRKGEPFAPDARMTDILSEAAAIANATARAITYAGRDPDIYFYEDRQWNSPFQRQSYVFLENGARVLDDRTYFHYMATGITPAMTSPPVGAGSVYAMTARDKDGAYLDGGKTYSLTFPGPVPMANFWSIMLYSGQTRSILETDQRSGGIDSNREGIVANDDGGYTIYFGPEAPEGKENNWAQTMPGKSFNVMMRLYGPLEPWFDKTWRPGDLELID